MAEKTVTFNVRLPGWLEGNEVRLALWEGSDGKPDQRFYLSAGDVAECIPVGRRWRGYDLYDVTVNVLPEAVHAVWEAGLAQTAYSAAAVAFYYILKGGQQ